MLYKRAERNGCSIQIPWPLANQRARWKNCVKLFLEFYALCIVVALLFFLELLTMRRCSIEKYVCFFIWNECGQFCVIISVCQMASHSHKIYPLHHKLGFYRLLVFIFTLHASLIVQFIWKDWFKYFWTQNTEPQIWHHRIQNFQSINKCRKILTLAQRMKIFTANNWTIWQTENWVLTKKQQNLKILLWGWISTISMYVYNWSTFQDYKLPQLSVNLS